MEANRPKTPIELWPLKQYTGRPGYSASHFARLDSADSPLLTAGRLAVAATSTAVLSKRLEYWEELCRNLDLVITVLQAYKERPGVAQMLKQAKTAARRNKKLQEQR